MSLKVTGRIREKESCLGVPNLVVKALDKDFFYDDLLGDTITNSEGNFEIIYEEKDFKEVFEKGPDLYIVVKTPDRSRVLYTSEKKVRCEAGVEENFEVIIPRATLGELAPKLPKMRDKTSDAIENRARVAIQAIQLQLEIYKADSKGSAGLLAAGKISEFSHALTVAAKFYEEALVVDAKNNEARARLALVKLKLGLLEEGLRDAAVLCHAFPEFRFSSLGGTPISGMTVLGDALRLNECEDKAREAYEKALAINPDDSYAAGRLAEKLVKDGDFKSAVQLVDRIERSGLFDALISTLHLGAKDTALLPAVVELTLIQLSVKMVV